LGGQAGITEGTAAAFEHALHTVLLVAAFCAMLGGIGSWLWIRLTESQAVR
jgi:hypothetical protein